MLVRRSLRQRGGCCRHGARGQADFLVLSGAEDDLLVGLGRQKAGNDLAVLGLDQIGGKLGVDEFGRFENALEDLGTSVFLADLAKLETEIQQGMKELEGMLK